MGVLLCISATLTIEENGMGISRGKSDLGSGCQREGKGQVLGGSVTKVSLEKPVET